MARRPLNRPMFRVPGVSRQPAGILASSPQLMQAAQRNMMLAGLEAASILAEAEAAKVAEAETTMALEAEAAKTAELDVAKVDGQDAQVAVQENLGD